MLKVDADRFCLALEKHEGIPAWTDGKWKEIAAEAAVDSAASRLLQLADVVAYARKSIVAEEFNARGLRERFGIELL